MISGNTFRGTIIPPLAITAVTTPATQADNSTSTAMSDKNPKAKRKQQAQQDMLRRLKAEEIKRHQQQLQESHMLKHPHEMKG